MSRFCLTFLTLSIGTPLGATLTIQHTEGELILSSPPTERFYYVLQQSPSLADFSAVAIEHGDEGIIWNLGATESARQFYLTRTVSLFAPEDSDRDGIDDLYELNHDILDPLDAADAELTVPGKQITYLQEYRNIFGFSDDAPQLYSREVTTFNFGTPIEAALSREITTFNFGSPSAPVEAISREISLYNGSGPVPYAAIPQVYSREITTFNFGAPSAPLEAISLEVSLYNGSDPLPYADIPQAYSREVTTFNFGSPSAPIEAISREVSVFAIAPE